MAEEKDKQGLPKLEEEILSLWKKNRIFEKSLKQNSRNKTFVFYEGPPTANGKPGLHHVLARSYKDIICRYKNMRGFNVPRQAGWDTHGLPVELQVEKALGLKNKKEIEGLVPKNKIASIKKFNEECKKSVWQHKELWENLTERMGFWLDTKNPYITYNPSYMESVWWIISEIYKKGLLYEGHKIIPWCPRCSTGLSSHEIAQGYKTVKDNSIFIKFKLFPNQKIGKNFFTDDNTFVISWTTTPWTLPGNVALAVGAKIKYSLVKSNNGEKYLLASPALNKNIVSGKKENEFLGNDLVGLRYHPLFKIKELVSENSYKIYPADFVTTDDGAGVVHTAVMYGADDYALGEKVNLKKTHTVDEFGRFKDFVPELAGIFVKSKEAEEKIISHLKKNNSFVSENLYEHEYPFCWRCDTPLIYYARSSWFIKMSALKSDLLKNNERINWVPSHIKEGRFGEWLKDVKDWALSRERYWGTPLPVWRCQKCQKEKIIGSVKDLEKEIPASGNSYFAIRHGQALSNKNNFVSFWPEKKKNPLTSLGVKQILASAKKLKKLNLDLIFSSDIERTKETAELIKKTLNIKTLIFDKRLREVDSGIFNGHQTMEYKKFFSSYPEKYFKTPEKGENFNDVKKRMVSFFKDIDKKYQNKKILIVSHESPINLLAEALRGEINKKDYNLKNAAFKKLPFKNLPLNDEGELDLHRPFIDEIEFACSCGGSLKRVPELIDVWFDSGAMPFASSNYPFKNKNLIDDKKFFPADYIAEAMDQTRGWFYTLLAISSLLKKGNSYKNVISLGLIHDKNGQKMSKSRGNIIDPWDLFSKYGADSVRWYLFTLNDAGEAKNFNEDDLKKIPLNVFNILKNCLTYLSTYRSDRKLNIPSKNTLDLWLKSRLLETSSEISSLLEKYNIPPAVRSLENLINDISRWFIRRSRSRFQNTENKNNLLEASSALYETLISVSKLMAPFAPFFADFLYLSLNSFWKEKGVKESVHLASWPKEKEKINFKLIKEMELIRNWSSLGLAERSASGIKVRQPLSEMKILIPASLVPEQSQRTALVSKELLDILKDEVNVKKITFSKDLPDNKEIALDLTITPELKEEGLSRELIRFIQSLRGEADLKPGELVNLYFESVPENLAVIISKREKEISSACSLKKIFFSKTNTQKINKTAPFENFGEISVSLK